MRCQHTKRLDFSQKLVCDKCKGKLGCIHTAEFINGVTIYSTVTCDECKKIKQAEQDELIRKERMRQSEQQRHANTKKWFDLLYKEEREKREARVEYKKWTGYDPTW